MSKIPLDWASRRKAQGALLLLSTLGCRTDFAVPQPYSPDAGARSPSLDPTAVPDGAAGNQDPAGRTDAGPGSGAPDGYRRPVLPAAGPLRGLFRIAAQSTGDCWDMAAGARVLQSPCDLLGEQQFELAPLGGAYRIVNARTRQCLHPAEGLDGSTLTSSLCSDDPQQSFGLERSGTDRFRVTTSRAGQCLEASASAGVQTVRTWTCNVDPAQQWDLRRQFASGSYQLVTKHSGMCLGVPGGSSNDGVRLQQLTCQGGVSQLFALVERAPNVFQLVNRSSGKCVDVQFSGLSDGIPVQQWGCNGTAAQFFSIESVNEYERLVNVGSGRCVQVAGSSTLDGDPVDQGACTNGDQQLWRLAVVPPLCPSEPCDPGDVTVTPEADTYVRDGINSNVNYGAAGILLAKLYLGPLGNHRISFLRFRLDQVGPNVTSATLRVRAIAVPLAKLVAVHAVSDIAWSESTLTWSSQPAIGLRQGASQTVGPAAAWHEFDVTGYVQAQRRANITAVSFALQQEVANDDTPTMFDSREGTNPPHLVIQSQ